MCGNFNITTDEHGIILIDGKRDTPIAKQLTTLLAYLSEIFRKHALDNHDTMALETILKGRIHGHFITIDIPDQIREKNPSVKQWEVPSDIIQMNNFYHKRISE